MPRLTVVLKIPFECEPPLGSCPALTFTHWLPSGRNQGIVVKDDDIQIVLWFDEKCVLPPPHPTADELKRQVNVLVHHVNVEIEVAALSDSLLSYMQNCDYSKPRKDTARNEQTEYERLAKRILVSVIGRINRLIAFARSKKGQYWLTEYNVDLNLTRSYFVKFEARGRVEEGSWFRFAPPTLDMLTASTENESRFITEGDWPAFRDFVLGANRPNLVGELLAGAEYLQNMGHCRSAISEAVTALEVAVHNFSRNPNAEKTFAGHLAERLALRTLHSQVERLGLSATIGYLLPTIVPEHTLPTTILSACQSALSERQNIVHNGKRNVDETTARRAITSIRACCSILESLTDSQLD